MTSYPSMAKKLGIPYCHGMERSGFTCRAGQHKLNGFVLDGTIHFSDRRITKVDTLAFLKLAAIACDPSINEDVPWRRVYRRDRLARELAARLRVRLPARFWDMDRAFVLAGVAGLPNDVPYRKQAYDWARR